MGVQTVNLFQLYTVTQVIYKSLHFEQKYKGHRPFSAATTRRLNRASQAVAPERRAVLLGFRLGADDHHGQPVYVRLLHDINSVVNGHSGDDFHQDLDDVFPSIVVVIVQEASSCAFSCRTDELGHGMVLNYYIQLRDQQLPYINILEQCAAQ
jgi:hypothetical protein